MSAPSRDRVARPRPAPGRPTWIALVVAVLAVAVRSAGAAGVEDSWLTTPVLGAFPWAVGLACLVLARLVIGLVAGSRGLAARAATTIALLTVVASAPLIVPRMLAAPQPTVSGPVVTVAVINARIGAADPQVVTDLVEQEGVQLLAVLELTRSSDAALRAAGLTALLPATAVEDVPAPHGGVYAVGELAPQRDGPPAGGTPDVRWRPTAGPEIQVTTAHAAAPVGPDATRRWRRGLARTPPAGDGPALVLADFNATLDHAAFRQLLDLGWRDAAAERGRGLAITYDGLVDSSPALPMAIDHVLVSPDVAVLDVRTADVPATDHRMLIARLRVPG